MVWGWRARAFRGEKSKEGAGSGPSPRLGDRGHTRELLLISVAPGQAFYLFTEATISSLFHSRSTGHMDAARKCGQTHTSSHICSPGLTHRAQLLGMVSFVDAVACFPLLCLCSAVALDLFFRFRLLRVSGPSCDFDYHRVD